MLNLLPKKFIKMKYCINFLFIKIEDVFYENSDGENNLNIFFISILSYVSVLNEAKFVENIVFAYKKLIYQAALIVILVHVRLIVP